MLNKWFLLTRLLAWLSSNIRVDKPLGLRNWRPGLWPFVSIICGCRANHPNLVAYDNNHSFILPHIFCGPGLWTGHGKGTYLSSVMFGASAGKTWKLGVMQQLGTRVIWKHIHSHGWWPSAKATAGCQPEHLHMASPCSPSAWVCLGPSEHANGNQGLKWSDPRQPAGSGVASMDLSRKLHSHEPT